MCLKSGTITNASLMRLPSQMPPILSWYWGAYQQMLRLAEEDRSLANDDYLDELIDRCLETHLAYCQETQQWFGWAYTEAVKYRLKLNNRLDKALETLECAEIRLQEEEEQKWLVENNNGTIKEAYKEFARLRCEIYLQQERWREAYDGLIENSPNFLEAFWAKFNERSLNYFYMLGRSAEGIGDWETARRYYADAHFAPEPHVEAQAGLKRVYHQIARRKTTDTFETFLETTEAEYRIREAESLEKFRQEFITNRLNKKATNFRLETLEGETYSLSAITRKVVLLHVATSQFGVYNEEMPEVKTVYEKFSKNDDVVVWGISDSSTPHQVRAFLAEHEPPWPVLFDPHQEVREAYQIKAMSSFFLLIDKTGNLQYSLVRPHLIDGQPLIWMIEALLSD